MEVCEHTISMCKFLKRAILGTLHMYLFVPLKLKTAKKHQEKIQKCTEQENGQQLPIMSHFKPIQKMVNDNVQAPDRMDIFNHKPISTKWKLFKLTNTFLNEPLSPEQSANVQPLLSSET